MRLLRRKEGCMNSLFIRRYMGGMNMDKYLIKTVTLDSAHEADDIGNPSYWSTFLDIPVRTDSTDRNFYICVFENNNAATTNYRIDVAMYYRDGSNNVACVYIRNNRSTVSSDMSTKISLYASIGTVIKVYKIPAVQL